MESTGRFAQWKEKHAGLWQFIMYMLMGLITTVVDFGTFALCNFLIFTGLRERVFSWWLIDYPTASGGLGAFLSFAISFAVSQIFNFFLQRKTTFKANNNPALSGVLYAVMVIGVYFLQLYVPTLIGGPICALFGAALGEIVLKCINMTSSMLIQYPINKFIIMRRNDKTAE